MGNTLEASVRTSSVGKGNARKLRKSGQIPAIMYGKNTEAMALAIDPTALVDMFRASGNRNMIVDLAVDGKTYPVLVQEVQREPVSREVLHVDFYRVVKGRKVSVLIPVETSGIPAGAEMGGQIRIIRRALSALCEYDCIPEKFIVDVSDMEIGDMIRVSDIKAPAGVEMEYQTNFNVITVYGKRAEIIETPDEEGEEGGEETEGEEASEDADGSES